MEANESRLVGELQSFDRGRRERALRELASMVEEGKIRFPAPLPITNMHLHTFYSFNAMGYSPARIIYEAKAKRLAAAGTVDFDVLDGVEETLLAGDLLEVKAAAGIETRVFIADYRGKVINSPNEPGIYYVAGIGFTSGEPKGEAAKKTLAKLRALAHRRTVEIAKRVNEFLGEVQVDFERDVAPLTPAGNATERHLLQAYDEAARRRFPKRGERVEFWATKLGEEEGKVAGILDKAAEFHELARARLMKFGSVGYAPPREENFPTFDEVVGMIRDAGAIPSATFLDGMSEGERDVRTLMEYVRAHGVEAVTLIPERNWRIADAGEKKRKLAKLAECIEVAKGLGMPLLAGTEMNKGGQPFVDDFETPELAPYTGDFLAGAHVVVEHTMRARGRGGAPGARER
ncbi:MAG: hypothetical protein V2A58_09250 [Planctomycetota bacterium]